MQYIVLTPGQEPEVVNAEPLSYDQMVAIVGYPLEVLNIVGGRARMFVCEEGKERNFPVNDDATELAQGSLDPSDRIVGTALIVGPESAGVSTSLKADTVAELLAMVSADAAQ